jgi:hypothetical protein
MKTIFKKITQKLYTIFVYINYYFSKKKYDKFIFIHPPQSGGNSIDYFFKINFGLRTYKINNFLEDSNFDFCSDKVSKYFLIFGHFTYEFVFRNHIRKNNFFYFTSIREPKSRFLSNYYRNKKDFEKDGKESMSLEKFLEMRLSQGEDNTYVRRFNSNNIYSDPTINVNNEHFLDSLSNLKKLNFIFYLDDMKENFINFKKNFKLVLDMTKLIDFHKNKVSNSTFPEVSPKENELLNKLTFYDTKLYEQIKKHQ